MTTDLDDLPLWRSCDRQTSRDAGRNAREFIGDHERRILEALAAGPGTKDEIASRCGLSEQMVIRRMARLRRIGRVVSTGETRRTPSGCRAEVWRAVL
jgi:hypothetical protein